MGESAANLADIAVIAERLRRRNPMNGDGYNSAITAIVKALDNLAGDTSPSEAAAAERQRLDDEYHARYYPQSVKP